MIGFSRDNGELTCDGVPLSAVARKVGTPVYVYSAASIEESFRRFDAAFAPVDHRVCYAAKANSNGTLLTALAALGAGADVVSGGELRACREAGFSSDRIVFSGVGKTASEIRSAVETGLLAINAESEREIEKIEAEAAQQGKTARVALRVNPDIDARSHPYISTGRKHNKFGVAIDLAPAIFRKAGGFPHVRMTGIQAHIGSQILDPQPLADAARDLARLARDLAAEGHQLSTLDVGGGIGLAGPGEKPLTPEAYAAAVLPPLAGLPVMVLVEPGRAIVGPAGALLTEVLESVTENRIPVERVTADVVGPICESSDFFLHDASIDLPREGDFLAIRDVGAYGFSMSSNYNFRGRPPEVWVEKGSFRVIRRREEFDDLVRAERE